MQIVLLMNEHVENVLEDKPSRQKVLDFVDDIESLEVIESNYMLRPMNIEILPDRKVTKK